MTKQESAQIKKFQKELSSMGYIVANPVFYRIRNGNKIGVRVGQYVHSCHIETSDIFVLLTPGDKMLPFPEPVTLTCWDSECEEIT